MAKRKRAIPQYGTVVLNGIEYYRTRIEDSDGNRVALYAKTPEKLYEVSASIHSATGDKLRDLSLLFGAYEARLHRPGLLHLWRL